MKIDARKIRVLMAEQRVNGVGISRKANISRCAFCNMMKKGSASIVTVGKIANALGVCVEDILLE